MIGRIEMPGPQPTVEEYQELARLLQKYLDSIEESMFVTKSIIESVLDMVRRDT